MRAVQCILGLLAVAGVFALRTASQATAEVGPRTPPDAGRADLLLGPTPLPLADLDTTLAVRPLHEVIEISDGPSPAGSGTAGHGPPPFELPSLEPIRFVMDARAIDPRSLDGAAPEIAPIERPGRRSDLLFRFDRNTNLSDGGLANADAGLPTENERFADTSSGERFNRYSMNIEWVPTGADNQLQWLVVGGVQAIKADIGRLDGGSLGLTQPISRAIVSSPSASASDPSRSSGGCACRVR
jgi:hypothetical protein